MNKMTTNFLHKVEAWWDRRAKWQKIFMVLGGICLVISLTAAAASGC